MTRFVSIISGSSSVGKTTLAINLAARLRAMGRFPLIMTEDTRWFSGDAMTAPPTAQDLRDLIVQQERLFDYIVTGPADIDAIILQLTRDPAKGVSAELVESFCQSMLALNEYDFFILDIAGGLSSTALTCCLAPCDCILVVTPEAAVLNQSLELLTILSANGFHDPLKVVVTQADGRVAPEDTYTQLQKTAAQRLQIPLEYWGFTNKFIHGDLKNSNLPYLLDVESDNRKYFAPLAAVLDDREGTFESELTPAAFWTQMIDLLSYPLQMPETDSNEKPGDTAGSRNYQTSNGPMVAALNAISNNLGIIGGELIQIRKLFEQVSNPESETGDSETENSKDASGIIPLDLEAYAAKRKSSKPED